MSFRRAWTVEEEYYLKSLIPESGKVDWNYIAKLMNGEFPEKMRVAKQCRARFTNYSKFLETDSELSKWKTTDIDLLCCAFEKHGPSWTRIAQFLPGKSQNSCKNKFYGALRKVIRKINKVIQTQSNRKKKLLKNQSVIRVIEAPETFHGLALYLKEQSIILRQRIFTMIKGKLEQTTNQQILQLYSRINTFNLNSRSFKSKKIKNHVETYSFKLETKQKIPEYPRDMGIIEYAQQGVSRIDYQMQLMNIFDGPQIKQLESLFCSQSTDQLQIEQDQVDVEQPTLKNLAISQDLNCASCIQPDYPCTSFTSIFSIQDLEVCSDDFFGSSQQLLTGSGHNIS